MIAALMSQTHKAGFELLSVRSGTAAKVPYKLRNEPNAIQFTSEAVREEFKGLLVKLRGEEGKQARKATEKLGDESERLWVKGGEADAGLDSLLTKFLS